MVQEHLTSAPSVAAGLRALPGLAQAFASTQAAWRCYANDRVCLGQLAQPLRAQARAALTASRGVYALVIHDWSFLHYNGHPSKRDRRALSQTTDRGYTLQSALLVSASDGAPLAPVFQGLQAAEGVHSSQSGRVEPPLAQLDALAPVLAFVEQLGWDKSAVHIIDAEADAVGHFRHWQRQGYAVVVRADGVNRVRYQGTPCSLEQVRQRWRRRGALRATREVAFQGRTAQQYVGVAAVTLTRPAKLQRQGRRGPRTLVRGEPLRLRLVVAALRDRQGKVLACWLLLTNVPASVPAQTVALWYYWRGRIESYFKLIKRAGLKVEHWQQESAAGLARRLRVASRACVLVWQIARSTAPAAGPWRSFLVRLRGRQMRRDRPFTEPARLAGLWVFVTLLEAIQHHDLTAMQRALDILLTNPGGVDSG